LSANSISFNLYDQRSWLVDGGGLDVDECQAGVCGDGVKPNGCQNSDGSYNCGCKDGYQFNNGKCEGTLISLLLPGLLQLLRLLLRPALLIPFGVGWFFVDLQNRSIS